MYIMYDNSLPEFSKFGKYIDNNSTDNDKRMWIILSLDE